MAEVVVFDIDAQSAIQKLIELRESTRLLKEQQKQLADQVKKGDEASAEAAKSYEANAIILKNLANEQRVLSRQVEGYSQVQKEATDVTNFANNSIQQNRDLLKQLTAQYINLKNPSAEATNQIKQLSDTLKQQESAIGDTRRNVGNYEGALKSAVSEIKVFGVSLGTLETTFNKYNGALKDAKTQLAAYITGQKAADGATKLSIISTGGLSAAMNVLRLALIATGIGAIVVAFGSLAAAILSTQKGADALNMVLTQVKTVFQATLGVAQQLGFQLIEIFKNPKEAINDLVNFLQNNLTNRLKGFRVLLDGILERDTKKITDGVFQIGTGIENLTDKIKETGKTAADFIAENLEKGRQIKNLQKEIEEIEINLNKQRALAAQRENELFLIAKNTNLSLKEREKAANEIIANAEELAKIEETAQQKKIEKLIIEQGLNDTNRKGNKELADLEAELITIQQRGLTKRKELLEVLNQVQKAENDLLKDKNKLLKEEQKLNAERQKQATENQKKFIEEFLTGLDKELELLDLQQEQRKEFLLQAGFSEQEILLKFREERLEIIDEFAKKEAEIQINTLAEVLASEQEFADAKLLLEQTKLEAAQGVTAILSEVFSEQNEIQKILLAVEKAAAIAQIVRETQAANVAARANVALYPPFVPNPLGLPIPSPAFVKALALAQAQVTANNIQAGISIATIAAQTIKSVALPKKAEGGEIEIGGKSHAQGGEIVTVGGRAVAEVEGGEGLYVMKKNAYQQIKQFSAINEAFGGKSWLKGSSRYLADGGAINTALPILESRSRVNTQIEQNRLLQDAIRNIPAPVLSIKEFEKKQAVKDKSVRISEL